MASCSPSGDDKTSGDESVWNCPLCLDNLKNPKLLPCSHTFCEKCLKNLIMHGNYGASFPCPSCRESIRVPKGGVTAFKTNYYIEATREKGENKPVCKIHKSRLRELEMYCIQCEMCICLECKLTDHLDHMTRDIEETASLAKGDLTRDMTGLDNTISNLRKHLESFHAEQRAIRDKKEVIRKDIQKRHQMIVSYADTCLDDALESLDFVTASIDSELCTDISKMANAVDELNKLRKRMDKCLQGEKGGGLVMTAQEIYKDSKKYENTVSTLLSHQITFVSRPVLRFSASANATLSAAQNFLGQVDKIEMAVEMPKYSITKMFSCQSQNESCKVFSLFPKADDTVWIAYEPCIFDNNKAGRHPELYDHRGRIKKSELSLFGRTNFMQTCHGSEVVCMQTPGYFSTFAKCGRPFRLKNSMKGTCIIESISKLDGATIPDSQFKIRCGPHCAFDVDKSEIHFAVLEEAQSPESSRKVHLYNRYSEVSFFTYTPPSPLFQPSDVCFYRMSGNEVLLVSDEINDAIHVVDVRDGSLMFTGYLAPDSGWMIQPTAMNIDNRGNLWVACHGGSILLCEPVS